MTKSAKMKIITINMPKSAVIKLRLIAKVLLNKPIEIVVGEDIVKEYKLSKAKTEKWLKSQRPFYANKYE